LQSPKFIFLVKIVDKISKTNPVKIILFEATRKMQKEKKVILIFV